MCRRSGHLNGIALTNRPHPDIEIAAAIRTVGEQVSIRRPGGFILESRVKGQLPESRLRQGPVSWPSLANQCSHHHSSKEQNSQYCRSHPQSQPEAFDLAAAGWTCVV